MYLKAFSASDCPLGEVPEEKTRFFLALAFHILISLSACITVLLQFSSFCDPFNGVSHRTGFSDWGDRFQFMLPDPLLRPG